MGGWYGGDVGPTDYLASEEDSGAGEMLDDDGTYWEDETAPDEAFPDVPETYDVGEYPEELEQSMSEDGDGDDEAGAAAVEAGGCFPGEGSVASR